MIDIVFVFILSVIFCVGALRISLSHGVLVFLVFGTYFFTFVVGGGAYLFFLTEFDFFANDQLFEVILYQAVLVILSAMPLYLLSKPASSEFKYRLSLVPAFKTRSKRNQLLLVYVLLAISGAYLIPANLLFFVFISGFYYLFNAKTKKFYFVHSVPLFILFFGAHQRSIVLPLLIVLGYVYLIGQGSLSKYAVYAIAVVSILLFALLGRSVGEDGNLAILWLAMDPEKLAQAGLNMITLNLGTLSFEMREVIPLSTSEAIAYLARCAIPVPTAFIDYDFNLTSISDYLGVTKSIGLPNPFVYEIYYLLGWPGAIFGPMLVVFASATERLFYRQPSSYFRGISMTALVVAIVYMYHSSARVVVSILVVSLVAMLLSRLKFRGT